MLVKSLSGNTENIKTNNGNICTLRFHSYYIFKDDKDKVVITNIAIFNENVSSDTC